jgi:hypothetical protein
LGTLEALGRDASAWRASELRGLWCAHIITIETSSGDVLDAVEFNEK